MRTFILCMPRSGSKLLQQVLAYDHQRFGHVSTLCSNGNVNRENFWCSLEEFTGFHLSSFNQFHASLRGEDVCLSSLNMSVEEEMINRLNILSCLNNYVVKHFVYPDPLNITSKVMDIAEQVFVLRRRDIQQQALSLSLSSTVGNYWASKDFVDALGQVRIDPQRYKHIYSSLMRGDEFLAQQPGQHIFMEDLVGMIDNNQLHQLGIQQVLDTCFIKFGEEYGTQKHTKIINAAELTMTLSK